MSGLRASSVLPCSQPIKIWRGQGLLPEVRALVNQCPVLDMHTHLFDPAFGQLNLFGIDALLTYHYLVAEYARASRLSQAEISEFLQKPKAEQAEMILQKLFVENTPISEACRGVLTTLEMLKISIKDSTLPLQPPLPQYRQMLQGVSYQDHVSRVLQLANVDRVVMTNDPFVEAERTVWLRGFERDPRFWAALRIDPLFTNWVRAQEVIQQDQGKTVGQDNYLGIRKFLGKWVATMKPVYLAASLPATFCYPAPKEDCCAQLLDQAVLPLAKDLNLPVALMIGVKRGLNPALGLAGDGVGRSKIAAVENLCLNNPEIRFLITMLHRDNQYELAVAARKFPNLMPFGCWWFLNTPSSITEITRMRFELLGTEFIPQHSDARVLDQLIYKWQHSREIIAAVLTEMYLKLPDSYELSTTQIQRDVHKLLRGNFVNFVGLKSEPLEAGGQD